MDVKVTDYMPDINSLSQEELAEVRDRLETYLRSKQEFRDLDLRPNSVLGDLMLSPLAHIVASLELAMNRILSDIDLGNVSQGTVYNCDFVKTYLNNFGEGQVYEYPSTGVVQLLFSEPDTKFIDYGTKFVFAADGGEYIYELVDVDNNITLRSPYEAGNLNDPFEKKLIKVSEGRYAVNLAVKGPAGVGVNADTVPKTDIGHASLIPNDRSSSTHSMWNSWEHGRVCDGDCERGSRQIAHSGSSAAPPLPPPLPPPPPPDNPSVTRRSSFFTQYCLWPPFFQCSFWHSGPQ